MQFNLRRKKLRENPTLVKQWRKNPQAIEKYQFMYSFLPHPDKKKRAGFLSNKAVFVYCGLIIIVTLLIRLTPKFFPGVLGYASNIIVKDLLSYTNKTRANSGLAELKLNNKLSEAAEQKAKDMFSKGYWAHVSPDGVEPWDFILGEDYDYIYAGENLAKNFSTSKEVVQAWYNSESHRSNLLSSNYDEVGFAVVNGVLNGYETTLVVQMFGRPRQPSMVAGVYEEEPAVEKEETSAFAQANQTEVSHGAPPEEIVYELVNTSVQPKIDITTATKSISAVFGGFVSSLLVVDIWYSRKKGIRKFNGQTFAHLTMLLVAIASVWFVLKPGIVL